MRQCTVERVAGVSGVTIEWQEPGHVIASRGSTLLVGSSLRGPFRRLATFPARRWKRLAGRARLGRRLLRHTFYNVIRTGGAKYFVVFDKSMAVLADGEWKAVRGAERPFRVLRSGAAWDLQDGVFFGEYLSNDDRGAIRVYRASLKDASMEVVHTFARGEIRHVHGIYRDPTDGSFWICAGDRGAECRVLRTSDRFATVDVVGSGDETWRAVSVEFTDTHVFYATDAEFVTNAIYSIERKTGRREKITPTGGTVLASAHLGGHLLFAVSGEQCPANPTGTAELWAVDEPTTSARRVLSTRRDPWNQQLFQYGQYLLPNRYSRLEGEVGLTTMGLRGADFSVYAVRSAGA